jgi:hypothetical protein
VRSPAPWLGKVVRVEAHDAVSSEKLEHALHLRRGYHQPQLGAMDTGPLRAPPDTPDPPSCKT